MTRFIFTFCSIYLRLISAVLAGKSSYSVIRRMATELILLRHQLQIAKKSSTKRMTLSPWDRLRVGLIMHLGAAKKSANRCAVLFRPSTLLSCHQYFVKRRYSKLFGKKPKKRGPKGKSKELVCLVLELKKNNPGYGCEKIAGLLTERGHPISDTTVARILKRNGLDGDYSKKGPSWQSFVGNSLDGLWTLDFFWVESVFLRTFVVMVVMDVYSRIIIGFSVCKYPITGTNACVMFNNIISGKKLPKRLCRDRDPIFKFHRWLENMRIFKRLDGMEELKSVAYVPVSNPFVETLIGKIRREYTNQLLFYGEADLEIKLSKYKRYFNEGRVHSRISFKTPHNHAQNIPSHLIDLNDVRWKSYCNGLYKVPSAA